MEAIESIIENIKNSKSFVLEAGAGAGKTYALIQTINHLIESRGDDLLLKNQRIVCITYTNVAKNEIIERLENNPLILVSTIHEFLWDCIKSFNKQLLVEFDNMNTSYHEEKPEKFTLGLINRIKRVEYTDKAFSEFEQGIVGHDDLIILAKRLFENYNLLSSIFASKYPYVLVDEYQDTAPETIHTLLDSILAKNKNNITIGFYGDSHQKIYNTGVGSLSTYVENNTIELVKKIENYRSSSNVIKLLNKIRTNIQQIIPDGIEKIDGEVKFINFTNYPSKTSGQKVKEYEDSLIPQKNINYDNTIKELENEGWDFTAGSEDKILIVANSRVARRGGFGNLYALYSKRFGQSANEALLKRENPITTLFLGSEDKKTSKERKTGIEHLVDFYLNLQYSEVVNFLKKNGLNSVNLKKHIDKKLITDKLDQLIKLRENKTIGEVLEFAIDNKLIVPSLGVTKFLDRINSNFENLDDKQRKRAEIDKTFFEALLTLPYLEVIHCFKHTQNQNVFSTKHGTKGEEYRNVLVVIDDTSWKGQYNFESYFDNSDDNIDRKERTKNLFYVSCSRAKEKLVVLALSKMGDNAMKTIRNWFSIDNIIEY
ncbi:MAG: ATP-dependent helicase [Ignavibacteriae bacterium]|nr:ATP-dependent helicase [Ignavibacteriota bacterium]